MIWLFLAYFLCIVTMGNGQTISDNPPSLRIQSIPIPINSTAFSLGIPTFQPSNKASVSTTSTKPMSTKAIIDKDNPTRINVYLRSVSASPTASSILATRYPTGTYQCFSSYPVIILQLAPIFAMAVCQ